MLAKRWREWLNRASQTLMGPSLSLSSKLRPTVLRLEELESRLTPSITFVTVPNSSVAGQPISPVVQVLVTAQGDGFSFPASADPVTLEVASGPGGFSPSGSPPTATTDSNGVATFNNLVLDAAGSYTFMASDAETESESAPSSTTVINPGPVSQIVVSAASPEVTEGEPVEFIVAAADQFGNPATGATIHFSSSTTQASLPPDYTFQAGDDGVQIFEATFTAAGTQTITATVAGSTVSAADSVEVDGVPPDNIQLNPSASDLPINQPVTLTGSFTDPGTLDSNTVVINWDDGSADTSLVLPAQTRSFNADHVYTAEGDYFPTVFITNADGGTGEASSEVQALDGPIDGVADAQGQPGQTSLVSASDAEGDSINATLILSADDAHGGGLLVAKLANASLPSTTNRADVLGIYDIRSTSAEAGDSALVTFRFRAGLDLSETPVLQFLDPATGTLRTFVASKHGAFELTRQGDYIVGSLFLDNTSTPTLQQLTHTVFTISVNVPSAAATATVSASVASANPLATAPATTATFSTTSQLTLTLEPTQSSQVSSGVSSFDAAASGGGAVAAAAPEDTAGALYSFLAEEVSGGVQVLLPFARQILPPATPAAVEPGAAAPGKITAHLEEQSLRDAADFLFRELASTITPLLSNKAAPAAPHAGSRLGGSHSWAPRSMLSSTKIGPTAFIAGLAVAMPEHRKKTDRSKADLES